MSKKQVNDIDAKLKRLALSNKVTLAEVKIQYTAETKRLIEMEDVKEDLSKLAFYATMNYYRKKNYTPKNTNRKEVTIVTVYGFIVGTNGIFDKIEIMRKQVLKFINEHGVPAAIEQQKINGDNDILDQREKVYGKPNLKYLKPLDPKLHEKQLTLYGFFRHNGDKVFKWGSIQSSDNKISMMWDKSIVKEGRYYLPCQVTAILGEEDKQDITLRASTAKDTMSIFKAVKEEVDIATIIEQSLKGRITPLGEVERNHEISKEAWDRKIFVKGVVAWINTERRDPLGNIKMGLMNPVDETELVIVRVPETVEITFGELSEVIVAGKTNRSKYRDQESKELVEGDVVIDAWMVYPTLKTKPTEGSSADEDLREGDVPEGWLS